MKSDSLMLTRLLASFALSLKRAAARLDLLAKTHHTNILALLGRSLPDQHSPLAAAREGMLFDMLKRHEIQVLRRAGHGLDEMARLAGVGRRRRSSVAAAC